ncbi:MAG: YihY/virulence factor BrkB family protein [Bacteroidales bacterium]|nr:YihY/virulence factor BrkB family protein [Bacteroidales bacterium]
MTQRISRIKEFFKFGVWNYDTEALSGIKARIVRETRLVLIMLKNFQEERIGFQSVALSYFSFMAVVPFLAVVFFVTKGFGLSSYVLNFITDKFSDYPMMVQSLTDSANKIIESAQSGLFGLISALMFVWLIIWMMMCVERVFNAVWKVEQNRNFFKRLGIDVLIMILSPFVIIIFSTGTVVYSHVLDLIVPNVDFSDSIKTVLGWVIFGAVAVLIISAMYKFIPNTKVKYINALKAASLAGVAFTILQFLYLETQVLVTRVNAVYGTLAAVPLFMLWMRYGWLVIFYGANLSYAYQHYDDEEYKKQTIEKA